MTAHRSVPARHPPDVEPALRAIAMPADANPHGDIFGGWLLSQMDLAGGTRRNPPRQGPHRHGGDHRDDVSSPGLHRR